MLNKLPNRLIIIYRSDRYNNRLTTNTFSVINWFWSLSTVIYNWNWVLSSFQRISGISYRIKYCHCLLWNVCYQRFRKQVLRIWNLYLPYVKLRRLFQIVYKLRNWKNLNKKLLYILPYVYHISTAILLTIEFLCLNFMTFIIILFYLCVRIRIQVCSCYEIRISLK